MSDFASKWSLWNSKTPNQSSATSDRSTEDAPSGTNGTISSGGLDNFERAKSGLSDDELARSVAAVITIRIAEYEAYQAVNAAWSDLTQQELVAMPDAALKRIIAMPKERPDQIARWRDAFLELIAASKLKGGKRCQ